ncbi:BamA/TamA family outer membrane protein [Saprospiraceae bacterium]|nr:BamA/TamA family outer membrane protein [Saprospiraceae bacterium]
MRRIIISTLCIIGMMLLYSCAAKKPYYRNQDDSAQFVDPIHPDDIDYEVFLVGDTGGDDTNYSESGIVDLIKTQIRESDVKQSVVFLGNSISEEGFPEAESPAYDKMNASMQHCINVLRGNTDKVFFIPGNSEWYDGKDYTASALNVVEDYIETDAGGKNIFVPSHGCGEPKVIDLTDDLILVLIDSQWILEGDRSGERKRANCEIDYEAELIFYIKEKLSKNKNKNIIIASHHPVYSNGRTGGNYGLASNLLPLPILGSMITGVKKISGGEQRFGHPQYEKYRTVISQIMNDYEGVVFASAHDKNMQYHNQDKNHYVIAGSGAETDYVRKKGTADFAYMEKGFAKITHTKDLELWLEFFAPDPEDPTNVISMYNKRLYKKEIINFQDTSVYHPLNEYDKTYTTEASEIYAKGIIGLGKAYRKEWGAEIEVPVFLLDEYSGGLKVVRQGGGFQTKSLRLEDSEGHQWVARTVNKDVTKVVPSILRGTFAQSVVQDGVSASHPYGAIVVPKLAEAIGVYHANPEVIWMPKQKALTEYNPDFGDKMYLFEERPGGNMEGHPNYGGAKKSINTLELLDKLRKNHKNQVDQEYVLRARMLDILIGDWDRHDDQWRWSEYTDDNGEEVYRAIPRDRDQVFFKNDGFINYIASRPYFNPQLRKFDNEIDYMDGVIFNARYFDRSFIAELNKEDFLAAAKYLQDNITDDVIADAFSDWPEKIYNQDGDIIISKLKKRREDLPKYAEEFYKIITKEVTVVGTDGKNIYDIVTLPNDQLDVKLYHLDKDKKHLLYSRVIDGEDCEELRLYGLKNSDVFNFSGEEESSVKVQLVGGSGDDVINNDSKDLHITAYDRADGMTLKGRKVKSRLKNRRGINRYDRTSWQLDRKIQFPILDFYTDEGVGLRYNIWWTKNGFRKSPFESNHKLSFSYFTTNTALLLDYSGYWQDVLGLDWDIQFDAEITGPVFTQFFYGLGNEYRNFEEEFPNEPDAGDNRFHIVKGSHVYLDPQFVCDLGNGKRMSIHPTGEFLNIKNRPSNPDENNFIFFPEAGLSDFDFENKYYAGMVMSYESDRVNNPLIPTRGYKFNARAQYRYSLSDSEFSNVTFESTLEAYIPFSPTHRIVFATEIGAAYTLGEYEFFHANYLATRDRMRGFRRNRFAGDGLVYAASDLRIKIFQGHGGLRTGVGVFGAFDYGRVFLDTEDNDDWHTSIGGGLFLTPLDIIGFKLGFYVGEDDTQVAIGGSLSF